MIQATGHIPFMRPTGRRQGLGAWLAERLPSIEPVELYAWRFAFFPRAFRRRGRSYRILYVERWWERAERSYRAGRRYFRVRCEDDQRYTLFQDLRLGTWHLVGAASA